MEPNRSVSWQAIGVSLLSTAGVLTTILVSVAVAYLYGATRERDSYLLASVIPTYIASVFSGNLSLLFVPIFIEHRTRDPERAWKTASSIVTLSAISLCALSALVIWFADDVASRLGGPSYDMVSLTASLLCILIPSAVFGSLTSLFASLHYAERRFLLPTLAPIISGVITVAIAVPLYSSLGIRGLALGTSVGALASLLALARGLVSPTRLTLRFELRDSRLLEMARSSLPLVLASLLYRFNPGFERMIGASLPEGSISFVAYASQIVAILATVTSAGVTTTVFPLLAQSWATRDLPAVRRYFGISVRSILLVSLPAAVFAAVFAEPLVRALLQRGAFRAEDTAAVANCLLWLLAGFVAANLGNVVTRCFYVAQRTHMLAAYTVLETALYVGLAIVLSNSLSYLGLAAATSVRDLISVCIYFWMASRFFGSLGGRRLLLDAARLASAAAIMFGILVALRAALDSQTHYLVAPCVGAILGFLVYAFCVVRVLRVEEAVRLVDMAREAFTSVRHAVSGAGKGLP
jgi:putative peptidoglycan lipid II flippase